MPENESLHQSVQEVLRAQPKREVIPLDHAGKRYWIKRARPTGSNPLHRIAWYLTRLPLLVPVLRQNAAQALRHESSKLQRLKSAGLPVPEVVERNDGYFVLEDAGPSMHSALREGLLPKSEESYGQVFDALGRLHRSGEYHGGSQLRNFTWKNGTVHYIDFEENFAPSIPLDTLQFRDLFLLLFSLAKDRHPVEYAPMIARYREQSGNIWAESRLREFARSLALLERLAAFPPVWNLLDKDSKATYRLLQELKKL